MDYGFRRPKEPWEASDGAVYLLRELAQVGLKSSPCQSSVLKVPYISCNQGSLASLVHVSIQVEKVLCIAQE